MPIKGLKLTIVVQAHEDKAHIKDLYKPKGVRQKPSHLKSKSHVPSERDRA